ncbi:peptidylprolyl isomerase [Candidatus Babeliales bacterium]|nr:peptidylprolyl isomerase [Candidatus Babeliales bacterium]
MIYIFRKEMKKWYTVLWIVLATLALSSLGAIFFRKPHPHEVSIASVAGRQISFKKYTQALNAVKAQIDMYRSYAKAYGVSVEMFINFAGLQNPEQVAFDQCVRNELIDKEKDEFNIQLNHSFFGKELIKRLPPQLKDATGNISMEAYNFYLNRQFTTIPEYEKSKEEDFERELFEKFIKNSYYVPLHFIKDSFVDDVVKKKFSILEFKFDNFLSEVKKKKINDNDLKEFFKKYKEDYRVPEKRKAEFWIILPKEYAKKIEIDDEIISNFYEKNRSTLFRIPPKVKVRRLLLKIEENSKPEQLQKILEKIKNIHKKALENPDKFESFVKKYSHDKETSSKGGLINFFDKGTYDPNFEKVAFRLKEKDQISDIVKTRDGYEILQLVERIAASEKSLDFVRDEIIETIKSKKSLMNLKGELAKVMHDLKTDDQAVLSFVKKNKLEVKKTDWLIEKDIRGDRLKNLLTEKIFAIRIKHRKYGYFVSGNDEYILFHLLDIKNSFIPDYDKIKDDVKNDYYEKMAKKLLKTEIRKAKRDLLQGKATLKDLSDKLKFKLQNTDFIKKSEKAEIFGFGEDFSQKAFLLNDSSCQILRYKNIPNYYLIRMVEFEEPDWTVFVKEKDRILQDDQYKQKPFYLEAFIASLLRTAKIKKLEKVPKIG